MINAGTVVEHSTDDLKIKGSNPTTCTSGTSGLYNKLWWLIIVASLIGDTTYG